jgi:hypothetical protein
LIWLFRILTGRKCGVTRVTRVLGNSAEGKKNEKQILKIFRSEIKEIGYDI